MRIAAITVLALLLGNGPSATPQTATIAGQVTFTRDGQVVPYDDGFVYLQESKHPKATGGDTFKAKIVQQGRKFVPRSLVVPLGAEIAFPNLDQEEHNVFSPTEPTFDLGRYPTDKVGKTEKFEDLDEFDIYCDIHRCMQASVKVVKTPPAWIVKVDRGAFALQGVPDGEYKLIAWAPHSTEVSVKVSVAGGQITATPSLDKIRVSLGQAASHHSRKDGKPYKPYPDCP